MIKIALIKYLLQTITIKKLSNFIKEKNINLKNDNKNKIVKDDVSKIITEDENKTDINIQINKIEKINYENNFQRPNKDIKENLSNDMDKIDIKTSNTNDNKYLEYKHIKDLKSLINTATKECFLYYKNNVKELIDNFQIDLVKQF